MQRFFKQRGWVLLLWLGLLVVALVALPNTDKFSTSGDIPSSYSSTQAAKIGAHWDRHSQKTYSVIAVFSHGDQPLSSQQNRQIKKTIHRLKQHRHRYQITDVTDASSSAQAKQQLVAKDKTTQMVELTVKQQNLTRLKHRLGRAIQTAHVKTYLTGSDLLDDDFSALTEKGVQKTEIIAIIFIFIVLLLVFRSPITPLISLLTVGIAGIISLSVVFNLVKFFGFPYSEFTEVFIIIVLFGIGTDYNILLYNEFRDGLGQKLTPQAALKRVMGSGRRTIIYSGLSVLIGMATLFGAKFYLYRSAAGIAIGIAVLLLVLLTLNPVLLRLLGKKMFWPGRSVTGEGSSRFWHFLSHHAWQRGILLGGLAVILIVPLALRGAGKLNYDDSREVPNTVASKQGFQLIQKHFSKGTSEPTTLYIAGRHRLDNERALKEIDRLTQQLKQADGVKTVLSASQPGGHRIKALYVNHQLAATTAGLAKLNRGLKQLKTGVNSAQKQLAVAQMTRQLESVKTLSTGANQLATGSQQLTKGLTAMSQQVQAANTQIKGVMTTLKTAGISGGLGSIQTGANQLTTAMTQVQSASQDLTTGAKTVAQGNQRLYQALVGLRQQVTTLKSGLTRMKQGLQQEQRGMGQVTQYLMGLQKSSAAQTFYLPQQQLRGKTYHDVLTAYFSANRRATQLTIIFKGNPSERKTMRQLSKIETLTKNSLQGTSLEHTTKAFDGMTSYNRDLSTLASKDFKRTAILMLVGILMALLVVTRSLFQSLAIEGILVTVYYAALSAVQGLSGWFLGDAQLAWNTPFFAFIMLIALGVDYSIFLMVKYRDLAAEQPSRRQRIIQAATTIGATVISAGIILAGTFAALIPSGVQTLIQVGLVVILGIVLLVIVIPIVLPIVIRLQNWALTHDLGQKN